MAAPESDRWCAPRSEPGQAKGDLVLFRTHPLIGKYIEKPKLSMGRNTIAMAAFRIKHGVASLENTDELQQFVEEWIKRGFGVNSTGSEPIVGDTAGPRFTVLSSSVRPGQFTDADCVRYEYVMEERDNPIVPNIVLILTDYGAVCHHPAARDYLVVIGLSERYQRGEQIDPNLLDRLRTQYGEPFISSLEFAQAD